MIAENLSSVADLFKTGSPTLIGVDIASTSLKLVELSDAGKGLYRLERYVIEPLPKDVVTDGNVLNIELASDVLKRAWKRLGSRNRNVALALPAAMVITKKIIVAAGQRVIAFIDTHLGQCRFDIIFTARWFYDWLRASLGGWRNLQLISFGLGGFGGFGGFFSGLGLFQNLSG